MRVRAYSGKIFVFSSMKVIGNNDDYDKNDDTRMENILKKR
jgi:hypothetical protein